jgi:hypothetical protein
MELVPQAIGTVFIGIPYRNEGAGTEYSPEDKVPVFLFILLSAFV